MVDQEFSLQLMEREQKLFDFVSWHIPERHAKQISAEDILQEVWIAAFRNRENLCLDLPDAMDRWLHTIARNKLVDAIRKAQSRREDGGSSGGLNYQDESFISLVELVEGRGRNVSSEYGAREAVSIVKLALSKLSPDELQAITLRYLDGLSNEDVARIMERSLGAINSLLHRARERLRDELGNASRFFSGELRVTKKPPTDQEGRNGKSKPG